MHATPIFEPPQIPRDTVVFRNQDLTNKGIVIIKKDEMGLIDHPIPTYLLGRWWYHIRFKSQHRSIAIPRDKFRLEA